MTNVIMLNKNEINTALICAKESDTIRPMTGSLHLTKTGHYVLTNGHFLIAHSLSNTLSESISIPFEHLEIHKKSDFLAIRIEDEIIKLSSNFGVTEIKKWCFSLPENWRRVIPAAPASKHVNISGNYAALIEKINKQFKPKDRSAFFPAMTYSYDDGKAVMVRFNDSSYIGVIMGIKPNDYEFTMPEWIMEA